MLSNVDPTTFPFFIFFLISFSLVLSLSLAFSCGSSGAGEVRLAPGGVAAARSVDGCVTPVATGGAGRRPVGDGLAALRRDAWSGARVLGGGRLLSRGQGGVRRVGPGRPTTVGGGAQIREPPQAERGRPTTGAGRVDTSVVVGVGGSAFSWPRRRWAQVGRASSLRRQIEGSPTSGEIRFGEVRWFSLLIACGSHRMRA